MSREHSFNVVERLVGSVAEPTCSAGLVAFVIVVLGFVGLRSLKRRKDPLVPDGGLSVANFWDGVALFTVKLGDAAMGRENRKYLPFTGCVFVYILFLNLLGLIPGFSMPTDAVQFNFGMAIVVFFAYHFWGLREVGLKDYLRHLWGPIFWIGFLLFPIEILSHCVRPLSLSLRLYGNMLGDHMVLGIFTKLTKFGVPVIFYFLGTFVSFMQAFIFTLLSMIYIRMSVTHEGH